MFIFLLENVVNVGTHKKGSCTMKTYIHIGIKSFFLLLSLAIELKKNEEKKVPLGGFLSLYPHELKRVFKLMFKI